MIYGEAWAYLGSVLNDLDDVLVLTIIEDGVGHAYFDKEEIENIGPDLLFKRVINSFVLKTKNGFIVEVEV